MAHASRSVGRAVFGVTLFVSLSGWTAGPAEGAFARRKVLTIDRTRVPGTANHVDFPVLVSISGDANLRTTANGGSVTSSAGHDILFRGEDAATCAPLASPCRLDHEIESYDGATGTLVAWVRVPTLRYSGAAGNSVVYLYYGDATVTCSQQNRTGVWNSGYREVFHLHEAADQTDSTVNAFTAAGRATVTGTAAGKVGRAIDLAAGASGLTPAHLNVSDGTLPTGTSFTLEAWVNFRTINAGQFIGFLSKGRECLNFDGDPDPAGGFCTSAPCGDWTGLYKIPDGSGNEVLSFEWAFGSACKALGLTDPRGAAANLLAGAWYHVAASFDNATSTRRLLVNGTEVATDAVGACIEAPIPQYTRLGTDSNQDFLDGQLDEVRVSFAARSNGWLQTGYNNQNAPGTFYLSTTDAAGPFAVAPTACPPRNPCAGGSGNCYYRSIGTAANTTTGTVSATNGSSVVTGTGTSWQSANRGRGDRITIDGIDYTILGVDAETQLRLTGPFLGTSGSGKAYTIARKFATLQAWEDCIDGPGGAGCEGVLSASLVADGRSEVGVVYDDSTFTGAGGLNILNVSGATTDAAHTITVTADGPSRHHGVSGAGVVLDNALNTAAAVRIQDQFVTVEWMEVRNGGGAGFHCIDFNPSVGPNRVLLRNNIVRNCSGQGIRLTGLAGQFFVADITNNILYRGSREGVRVNATLGTGSQVRILNNTFLRNNGATEVSTAETPNPYVTLRNNIVVDDAQAPDLTWNGAALCTNATTCDWWNAASGNNVVGDAAPWGPPANWQADIGPNPRGAGVASATEASLSFVNATAGSENLHIQAGSAAWNRGSDLTGAVQGDIDATIRTAPWDVGADELPASAAPPLIVLSDTAASAPRVLRYTTLQGGTWTGPALTAVPGPFSTGAPLFSKVARTHPNGLRRAAIASENDGAAGGAKLQASFWDGTNWDNGTGVPYSDAHQLGTTLSTPATTRHFDAAYEQLSGELLVVSGSNTDDTAFIWTYNGTAWSGNLFFTPVGNGQIGTNSEDLVNTFRWVRLEPRPGTDQIAFIGSATDASAGDSAVISAAIWNGATNAFGSKQTLSLPVSGPDGSTPQNPHVTDGIDIDFVLGGTNAGEAVAVWGTQTRLWRRIWNPGTGWGTNASVQDLGAGNTLRWIRQKAASNGDDLVLAIEDTNERIYTIRYDGNTRSFASFTAVPHSTTAYGNADQNRPFDVVWDPGQGASNVLLVYSDTAGIKYRTSGDGGATWSGEQTLTALYQAHWVQLERDPSNVVHLAIKDQADDLRAWKWTASTWTVTSTPTLPSTNVETNGASQNVEAFAIASYPPVGSGTTAVKLMSFSALGADASVVLRWQTGSELDNLGFHVHRSLSADGPWTRLTGSLVPGLGSSPLGQGYSWVDSGLVNGQRYYYRLEDVDTASASTFHGPVSAVPGAEAVPPEPPATPPGGGSEGEGSPRAGPCPSWVLAAFAEAAPSAADGTRCAAYGTPEAVSLREVSRDARQATLELRTGGFYAVHEAGGTVRAFVPGFGFPEAPGAPALPLRRTLVEAPVGRSVRVASVAARGLRAFPGLRPSAVGEAEMRLGGDGTVSPGRRAVASPRVGPGALPQRAAWLAGTVFQGEAKSAVVELQPVRFDAARGRLVLAQRVTVRLAFAGRETAETGSGRLGRRTPRAVPPREVLVRLHTTRRGLHAVAFEDLFPGRQRALPASLLRLQRQGTAVPFHLEPASATFGPGGALFFHADAGPASTDFAPEVAWELVRSSEGSAMPVAAAAPAGPAIGASASATAAFEVNRVYQPGLLDAPDPWLWDGMASGVARVKPFTLSGLDTASARDATLAVDLVGGSDSPAVSGDHHVRVSVNGIDVGEALFDGKRPHRLEAAVPATLLREGPNELAVVNVGDTGASSLVFLDRFTLSWPSPAALRGGAFEGEWPEGGIAEVQASAPPVAVLDVSDPDGARWLTGHETSGGAVRFGAEPGRRYLVAAREGLLSPRVARPAATGLLHPSNRADYLLVAPREMLAAAAPLLERRAAQGLAARGVAFEEIAEVFGHGRPSAEAIRAFVSHAFHSWSRPSPRYLVLLGDSTYDPRRFLASSETSPLPALWTRTSYLWTASDPLLAAVNGDDPLPDLAVGRLPARTPEEAERLVAKLLAWEDSAQGLGGRAVLVADDPDAAGDFEANVEDLRSSVLAGRDARVLRLREGAGRPEILSAFDEGASLLSYVGHGGAAVWASENVLNTWDAPALLAQSRQPLLLTMNCLNGYFVAPSFDALAEAFVKVDGRGAIAAFSPSGLSLDAPAHQLHRALLGEIAASRHERLGDAVLAAQRAYAESGLMPELVGVYQLLGDPATRIRP